MLASDPAGATTVANGYDAQSRLTSKSNPYRSTSDPTYGLESYAYDGLDRQISNTHADNNVAYTYLGANVTSGGGISSQLCSSGCAGSGCTSVRQDYDYNNRLQLVRLQLGSQINESSMACWVYNYYPAWGIPLPPRRSKARRRTNRQGPTAPPNGTSGGEGG